MKLPSSIRTLRILTELSTSNNRFNELLPSYSTFFIWPQVVFPTCNFPSHSIFAKMRSKSPSSLAQINVHSIWSQLLRRGSPLFSAKVFIVFPTEDFKVPSPPDSINVLRDSGFCMVSEGFFVGEGIFNLKDGTFERGSLKIIGNNKMI